MAPDRPNGKPTSARLPLSRGVHSGASSTRTSRFLSRTVFSLSATIEQWLRSLGRHLGAEVTPEPAEPMR